MSHTTRDVDINILAEESNLEKLNEALKELKAEVVAVPEFDIKYLQQGLAIHFRLMHPEAQNIRLDVMSVMRGVDSFENLWARRVAHQVDDVLFYSLSIPDLVQAKKTQRDKDWPMIRMLVEISYHKNASHPTPQLIEFWLRECRTSSLLIKLVQDFAVEANKLIDSRVLLKAAIEKDAMKLERELADEQLAERIADMKYWDPLFKELEQLRFAARQKKKNN